MSTTVTYTGSLGAGMTAVIYDHGSENVALGLSDGNGEWSDTRRLMVIGPASAYDAVVAVYTSTLGFNAAHPYQPQLLGGPIKPARKVNGGWMVDVTYSRPPQGTWGNPNPLLRSIVIGLQWTFLKIPAEIDSQGFVVVNSAGDINDPPQTVDLALARIRVLKWQSSFDGNAAATIIGKVNAAAVSLPNSVGDVASRCLKCLNYAPANDIILAAPYVPVLYEFEVKFDKYDRKLLDKGYRAWYLGTTGDDKYIGKLTQAMHVDEPIPNAVLLNGQGKPIFTDTVTVHDDKKGFSAFTNNSKLPAYLTAVQAADGAGGYFLPYRIEGEADFSVFEDAGL